MRPESTGSGLASVCFPSWKDVSTSRLSRVIKCRVLQLRYCWHLHRPCLRLKPARNRSSLWTRILREEIALFGKARASTFALDRTRGPGADGHCRLVWPRKSPPPSSGATHRRGAKSRDRQGFAGLPSRACLAVRCFRQARGRQATCLPPYLSVAAPFP